MEARIHRLYQQCTPDDLASWQLRYWPPLRMTGRNSGFWRLSESKLFTLRRNIKPYFMMMDAAIAEGIDDRRAMSAPPSALPVIMPFLSGLRYTTLYRRGAWTYQGRPDMAAATFSIYYTTKFITYGYVVSGHTWLPAKQGDDSRA